MSSEKKSNENFENLSRGISSDERETLLERVKDKVPEPEEKDSLVAEKVARYDNDLDFDFKELFKKQSIWEKLAIWMWSFLTHSTVRDVLNKKILAEYAKRIEISNPGLIVFSRKTVTNLFYEKLKQLNGAIAFFKPYLENYQENPENYYFILGHMAMPELEKEILEETDPYKFPLDEKIPESEKTKLKDLLRKKLASMSQPDKKLMGSLVQMFEWMYQLSTISTERLISMFTIGESGGYECLFSFLRSDLEKLVEVMYNYIPLDDSIVDFYCILAEKNNIDVNTFRNQALANLSTIESFAKNIPLEDMIRIIKNNSLYNIPLKTFSVKWFESYQAKWISVFEERFSSWTRDFSREQIKGKIHSYFGYIDFPLFPSRPWQELGQDFVFPYEMTIGIITSFMMQHFNAYNKTFQTIAVKGEFASKENLHEFNEAVDSFIKLHEEIASLVTLFSDKGDYYEEFRIYHSLKNKSSNSTKRVHVIMENFEMEVMDIQETFCAMCQHLMCILEGCLSEKRTGKYCTLLNINRLTSDGVDFKEIIMDRLQGVIHIYEIVKDLEILEI